MAKKQTTQENVSITVSLNSDIARIFDEICREQGKRPDDVLLWAVHSHIHEFLQSIERDQDTRESNIVKALSSLFDKFPAKQRLSFMGYDRWPWVKKGAPASLKAAKAAAVRRGKRQAAKFAEQDRVLAASKVGA